MTSTEMQKTGFDARHPLLPGSVDAIEARAADGLAGRAGPNGAADIRRVARVLARLMPALHQAMVTPAGDFEAALVDLGGPLPAGRADDEPVDG